LFFFAPNLLKSAKNVVHRADAFLHLCSVVYVHDVDDADVAQLSRLLCSYVGPIVPAECTRV